MKKFLPIALAVILPAAHAVTAGKDDLPFLAEGPKSFELHAAVAASGAAFFFKDLEAPNPRYSMRTFIAKYHGNGKEPPIGQGSMISGTPLGYERLTICVAVRSVEAPQMLLGPRPDGEKALAPPGGNYRCENWAPGTGSTYLGVSIMEHSGNGDGATWEGTGTGETIKHSEIDMMKSHGPFDCAKLPFKFETQATVREHAIPVFAWFPLDFDVALKREKLTGADMPKGTVIVYAVINEKTTAD